MLEIKSRHGHERVSRHCSLKHENGVGIDMKHGQRRDTTSSDSKTSIRTLQFVSMFTTKLSCVSMVPFGRPVVPRSTVRQPSHLLVHLSPYSRSERRSFVSARISDFRVLFRTAHHNSVFHSIVFSHCQCLVLSRKLMCDRSELWSSNRRAVWRVPARVYSGFTALSAAPTLVVANVAITKST